MHSKQQLSKRVLNTLMYKHLLKRALQQQMGPWSCKRWINLWNPIQDATGIRTTHMGHELECDAKSIIQLFYRDLQFQSQTILRDIQSHTCREKFGLQNVSHKKTPNATPKAPATTWVANRQQPTLTRWNIQSETICPQTLQNMSTNFDEKSKPETRRHGGQTCIGEIAPGDPAVETATVTETAWLTNRAANVATIAIVSFVATWPATGTITIVGCVAHGENTTTEIACGAPPNGTREHTDPMPPQELAPLELHLLLPTRVGRHFSQLLAQNSATSGSILVLELTHHMLVSQLVVAAASAQRRTGCFQISAHVTLVAQMQLAGRKDCQHTSCERNRWQIHGAICDNGGRICTCEFCNLAARHASWSDRRSTTKRFIVNNVGSRSASKLHRHKDETEKPVAIREQIKLKVNICRRTQFSAKIAEMEENNKEMHKE